MLLMCSFITTHWTGLLGQGIVFHKRRTDMHGEDNPFGESMELIKAEALAHGCRPNKLMHALYCEAYMLFGRELVRLKRLLHSPCFALPNVLPCIR